MKTTIRNAVSTAALLLACCSPVLADDDDLRAEADKAIKVLENADSGLTNCFNRAAGFAIFPSVGKGGLFFGAERGNGAVYEKGKPVGGATLTEINVGAQVGGQIFYEVIFFESAKVSAVIAAEGAALNARYRAGVMVFTLPKTGLMAQASIGGQKFKYKPLD
jgi:lipid-binding SYLF domain-containing protein